MDSKEKFFYETPTLIVVELQPDAHLLQTSDVEDYVVKDELFW